MFSLFETMDEPQDSKLAARFVATDEFKTSPLLDVLATKEFEVEWVDVESDWDNQFLNAGVQLVVINFQPHLAERITKFCAGRTDSNHKLHVLLLVDRAYLGGIRELEVAGVDDILIHPVDQGRFEHRLSVVQKYLEIERQASIELRERAKATEALQSLNESLSAASRRFEALFNGLPVACFTFDRDGLIQEWNALSQSFFGLEGWEVFMSPLWDALDPNGTGSWNYDRVEAIFTESEVQEFDWCYTKKDGSEVFLACKVLCLTNTKGEKVAAIAGNLDITARVLAQRKIDEQVKEIQSYAQKLEANKRKLEAMNKKLHDLAVTDGLTGLSNRRKFQETLEEACARYKRLDKQFSLLLFDIDFFKKFNDEFGHQAGDDILRQFSKVLQRTARKYELPARYGGEEFAIIVEGCPATKGLLAAERFRKAVESQPWKYRQVTTSVGVSTYTGTETPKEMIEKADEALYASKHAGRNRSTHYAELKVAA